MSPAEYTISDFFELWHFREFSDLSLGLQQFRISGGEEAWECHHEIRLGAHAGRTFFRRTPSTEIPFLDDLGFGAHFRKIARRDTPTERTNDLAFLQHPGLVVLFQAVLASDFTLGALRQPGQTRPERLGHRKSTPVCPDSTGVIGGDQSRGQGKLARSRLLLQDQVRRHLHNNLHYDVHTQCANVGWLFAQMW